jgi:hypothetical protein
MNNWPSSFLCIIDAKLHSGADAIINVSNRFLGVKPPRQTAFDA